MSKNYQRIWHTVAVIPAGRVASYGQVADLAGLPGRSRLVGRALRETPSDFQLPWHRVLRADGRIAFPVGSPQAIEQTERLRSEGVSVLNGRVQMTKFGWRPDLTDILMRLDH